MEPPFFIHPNEPSVASVDVDAVRPLVTVVLPVLNGAGRLEHALDALMRQDFPRECFEIIVADGRSQDATPAIARSFGCRVLDNPGVTVAAGRNVGIQNARGELIAFSEDDIRLPPHWLSSAVRLLRQSGAAGVGGPTPIPPQSSLWSRAVNAVFRVASRTGASVQSDRAHAGLVDDLPGGNSLYRVNVLRDAGPIDERLTTAEDVAMHHELRRRGWELRLYAELAAEHHKRDSVSGFFRQMQRFAIGRVQLWRRWSGGLSTLHWGAAAVGLVGPLLVALLCIQGVATGMLVIGLAGTLAALTAVLVALRQGEELRVALLFPAAMLVFFVGWSAGFWSELILPSPNPRRVLLSEKLQDILVAPFDDSRPLRWLVCSFVLLESVLFAVFSQRAPFIMDEFQQGGYAQHIARGYYSAVVPFKTVLFTYLYYLPRLWVDRARDILLFQRAETVLLVGSTLCVLYLTSRELGRSRSEAAVVVATTMGFSTFFEHACSLRAEPFALLLGALALHIVIVATSRRLALWHYWVGGAALSAAFFCTQKAVWFCASVGLGTVVGAWVDARCTLGAPPRLSHGVRVALERALRLVGGFLIVAALYCISFPPATPQQVFRGVFLRSSQFALGPANDYGDLSQFIVQVFERSWWLFFICIAGVSVAASRVVRSAPFAICWVATLAMGALVLSWKEPWPYTFTWWIPLLAVFAPDAFRVASYCISSRSRRGARVLVFAAMLVVLCGTLPRTIQAMGWSNRLQLEIVDRVEGLLGPGEFYQDGIGMISTRPLSGLVWWDVPAIKRIRREASRGESAELTRAFRDPPKILIMSYRLQNLGSVLEPYLRDSYVPVDGGLLVAGTQLRRGATLFDARWEGHYALVERDGRQSDERWSIDEVEDIGPRLITRGVREIRANDCHGCFVIPADIVSKVKPAVALTPVLLFDRTYTR